MNILLAYIDPGSGSLLIQAIIASIVAVPFLLRRQVAQLVDAIRGRNPERDASTAPSEQAKDR